MTKNSSEEIPTNLLDMPTKNNQESTLYQMLCELHQNKVTINDEEVPPKIKRVVPSSVLSRVKNFLPKMNEANETLQKDIESGKIEEYNLENVNNCEKVIEMDLSVVPEELDENLEKFLCTNTECTTETEKLADSVTHSAVKRNNLEEKIIEEL